MSYLKGLKRFVTANDIHGSAVNFNYFKGTNIHKSLCGGIFTIIVVKVVLFFGLFMLISMLIGNKATYSSSLEPADPKTLYIPDF